MEQTYQINPLTKIITQEKINRYAAASGDYNPIHVDKEFALKTPFGGTIAHGMLILGYISELMTGRFGINWLAGGQLRVRFKLPARPGDTLTVKATLRQIKEINGRNNISYNITCENQKEEILVLGDASVNM